MFPTQSRVLTFHNMLTFLKFGLIIPNVFPLLSLKKICYGCRWSCLSVSPTGPWAEPLSLPLRKRFNRKYPMSKNTPVHQTQNIFFIIFLSSSSASLPFLCELVLLCSLFNPAELTYGEKKSYLSSAAVTVPLQVAVENYTGASAGLSVLVLDKPCAW